MAKVKITGHASGTGVVTVTAPNTSTDRTITLPDETATLSTFNPDGAVTINDTGADVDFRVESDTIANALFVQGSDGAVGIGTGTPSVSLEISHASPKLRLNDTTYNYYSEVFCNNSGDLILGADQGNNGTGAMSLRTGTTERLNITADGRGLSQFTAKAWVNFNGLNTIAIRDSHNVSSLTDNGAGSYAVNFSNNMANTNYCAIVGGRWDSTNGGVYYQYQYVGSCRIQTSNYSGTNADTDTVPFMVFGD